mgnify:CR=1 FL=1
MNKKGFTLIEVIVSIILVSVVLTSMLASLVKLRNAYEEATKNTDALVFSSSLARIINNDFAQNGGIRYIDCTYFGDVCDITLNNNVRGDKTNAQDTKQENRGSSRKNGLMDIIKILI